MLSIQLNCTPSIKLSTKDLRCFYTATATESNVTTLIKKELEHESSKSLKILRVTDVGCGTTGS